MQKSLAMIGQVWDGYPSLATHRARGKLAEDVRDIVNKESKQSGLNGRAEFAQPGVSLTAALVAKAVKIADVDRLACRGALT